MTGTASPFPRASSPAVRVLISESPTAAPEAYSWGVCDVEQAGAAQGLGVVDPAVLGGRRPTPGGPRGGVQVTWTLSPVVLCLR